MLLAEKQEIAGTDIPLPENKHLEEHIHNGSIKAMIEKQERDIIRKYLVSLGSARKVASQVGLSHTTVLNKIKQYHLEHLLSRNKNSFFGIHMFFIIVMFYMDKIPSPLNLGSQHLQNELLL